MARRWLATILCATVASCVMPPLEASGVQALTAGYDQALQKLEAAGRQKTQREAQRQAAGAVADLQVVVERQPDSAPALAALAEARLLIALQDHEARREARSLAQRALAISSTQARAHSAVAWLHFFEDRRFTEARRGFERALSLDPGLVFARFGYGLLLASQGEFDRALQEVERAERSGLVRPNWRMGSQAVLFFARRYEAAVRRARAPLEGSPAPGGPDHFWAGTALLAAEDVAAAITALEERVRETNRIPGSVAALAIAYARGGRIEQARELLPEIRGHLRRVEESGRRPCAENPCYLFALVDLSLGDKAAALAMLERAVADEPPGIWNVWLKVDPRMDPLRGDPRFEEILSRAGFR